jgi:hypothetical protein
MMGLSRNGEEARMSRSVRIFMTDMARATLQRWEVARGLALRTPD